MAFASQQLAQPNQTQPAAVSPNWFTDNAPPAAQPGAALTPPGPEATPDQIRNYVTQYYASKGVTPNPTSIDYWTQKWGEFGSKDPAYFQQRLSTADEFTGGPQASGKAPGGSPADIMAQDPGYEFRMGEGLKALQHSAAARGTLLTGGTLKGIARYGQDYASGEFGNVFNRNLSLAQLGENAAANAAGAGSSYARGAAGTTEDQGNATAAGQVGSTNAWTNALGSGVNEFLDWLKRRQGTTPASPQGDPNVGG